MGSSDQTFESFPQSFTVSRSMAWSFLMIPTSSCWRGSGAGIFLATRSSSVHMLQR